MTSELEIRKVMVDSRYRSSGSSSNFYFDLPQTVSLPPGTKAYITDVLIPTAWYTVESGLNDRLYMEVPALAQDGQQTTFFLVIPNGSYNADSLSSAINNALTSRFQNLTPTVGNFYTRNTNKIEFQGSHEFKIYSEVELKALSSLGIFSNPTHTAASPSDPRSINTVLGVESNQLALSHRFFVDIRSFHQVLINSSSLGSLKTLGPNGSQTAVKRIPVTADFGGVSMYDAVNHFDYVECGNCTLSRMHFWITDVGGREIPLHGAGVSFSIIFAMQ